MHVSKTASKDTAGNLHPLLWCILAAYSCQQPVALSIFHRVSSLQRYGTPTPSCVSQLWGISSAWVWMSFANGVASSHCQQTPPMSNTCAITIPTISAHWWVPLLISLTDILASAFDASRVPRKVVIWANASWYLFPCMLGTYFWAAYYKHCKPPSLPWRCSFGLVNRFISAICFETIIQCHIKDSIIKQSVALREGQLGGCPYPLLWAWNLRQQQQVNPLLLSYQCCLLQPRTLLPTQKLLVGHVNTNHWKQICHHHCHQLHQHWVRNCQ